MMSGGWYCSDCGALYAELPVGAVTCRVCGRTGMRGYDGPPPKRLGCGAHPAWRGWDDGDVNDDLARHLRREHGPSPAVLPEKEQRCGVCGRSSTDPGVTCSPLIDGAWICRDSIDRVVANGADQ